MSEKIVIRSFESAEFGETAQTQLEAAGIWCALVDSNDLDAQTTVSEDAGTSHLVVLEADKVRAIYAISGDWEHGSTPNESPARCPNCRNATYKMGPSFYFLIIMQLITAIAVIAARVLEPPYIATIFWIAIPLGLASIIAFRTSCFGVQCRSCGQRGFLKDFRIKLSKRND